MAGYRRVNYYELCRLCTSSEGTKMHIFREEGRRRSLPSKIQTCLPLQIQEEDSLPKIICSSCVEKLESYFEFREACINAEAMLESYFTSLKYSDDVSREGKMSVYVKEEPIKKKEETTKPKAPASNITNLNNVTSIGEGNSILPSAIQIITDPEGNRLTQYKVQVQGLVPYGEQSGLPLSVSIPALAPPPVKQLPTSTANSSRSDETQTSNESQVLPPPPPLVAAVTIAPHNQEILHQIGIATKDRNSVAEVLKLKNINILEAGSCESVAVANPQIHGNQITGQVSNIIPAQIRLDQNQLNQLINSNLQINLSQFQTQRENSQLSKSVNVTRNVVQITQSEAKMDSKADEEKDSGDPKVSAETPNGRSDSLNNSESEKPSISITEISKPDRGSKYEDEDVEMDHNLQEMEEGNDGNQQSVTSEESQTLNCDTCSKAFKRREHLLQHKRSHSGERPFVCTTCSKAFSRKEHLLRHTVSHTGQKIFTCEVCSKSFSRKDNLHKHRKTHGINGPYVCEICGKSFVVKHYYVAHIAQHENAPNSENSLKDLTCSNSITNPLPYKCDVCTKSFSENSYLVSHRMRHRNRVKVEPGERPRPQQQQQQQQSSQQSQPQTQQEQTSSDITIPQSTILTSFPTAAGNLNLATLNTQLTTINPSALLTPNIIHHSSANVVQIGNNSYLCAPNVTSELLEQYRRIHSS